MLLANFVFLKLKISGIYYAYIFFFSDSIIVESSITKYPDSINVNQLYIEGRFNLLLSFNFDRKTCLDGYF